MGQEAGLAADGALAAISPDGAVLEAPTQRGGPGVGGCHLLSNVRRLGRREEPGAGGLRDTRLGLLPGIGRAVKCVAEGPGRGPSHDERVRRVLPGTLDVAVFAPNQGVFQNTCKSRLRGQLAVGGWHRALQAADAKHQHCQWHLERS